MRNFECGWNQNDLAGNVAFTTRKCYTKKNTLIK